MSKLSPISGLKLIKILCNHYGFAIERRKGSHVTLGNNNTYVTVPAHNIGVGLLSSILKDCSIDKEEFQQHA